MTSQEEQTSGDLSAELAGKHSVVTDETCDGGTFL